MQPRLVRLVVLTASGLVIACLGAIALGGRSSAIATSAGTPAFWPPGIQVEYLASSPLRLPIIATPQGTGPSTITQTNVNLMQITYAPGAALDIH